MSLESGRKLGLTASLIYVIVPVATIILYGAFFFSLLFSITSVFVSRTPNFGFSFAILIAFVILGIVSFVGVILFLVAMNNLANYYKEQAIFKKALNGFLISLIGGIVLLAVALALILVAIPSLTLTDSSGFAGSFVVLGILAGIAISGLIIGLMSALFTKRAFDKLAEKSGVNSFGTAGLLILIGVIVPIVAWIGWIIAATGFNALKTSTSQPTQTGYNYSQPPTYNTVQKKYCPYCGAENNAESIYCKNCGKQLT